MWRKKPPIGVGELTVDAPMGGLPGDKPTDILGVTVPMKRDSPPSEASMIDNESAEGQVDGAATTTEPRTAQL